VFRHHIGVVLSSMFVASLSHASHLKITTKRDIPTMEIWATDTTYVQGRRMAGVIALV
jgi:hypothetical protein